MNEPATLLPKIMFLDERSYDLNQLSKRSIVGCCVFGRDQWMNFHSQVKDVGAIRPKRRLQAIDQLLIKMQGMAILAYADTPTQLLPSGETDGTSDIPKMSRTDNAWSMGIVSTVLIAIARLQRMGHSGLVDLYYDRKDITDNHRITLENTLRKKLLEIAKEAAERYPNLPAGDPNKLELDKICSVSKPDRKETPNIFQQGTGLAHHFCVQASDLIDRGSTERIFVENISTDICNMISKFTIQMAN